MLGDEYEDYVAADEDFENIDGDEEDNIVSDKKYNDIYDFDEDGDDRNE